MFSLASTTRQYRTFQGTWLSFGPSWVNLVDD